MAGPHTYIGNISGDFSDGTNFDTGLVPATAEAWQMNHQTQRAITAGLNQAAKTFSRVSIHPSCAYGIPVALQCDITELRWCGGGEPCYFKGTVANLTADSRARSSPGLSLDGAFTLINILSGWVQLLGSAARVAAVGSRITVDGPAGADPENAKLTIDSTNQDLTTNDTVVTLGNGRIDTIAGVDKLIQRAGTFNLGREAQATPDTAALLLGDLLGGTFNWNSSGTIAEAHCSGDHRFGLNNSDLVRILTALSMHGECVVDLTGGFNLTPPAAIRRCGGTLIAPIGRTLAIAG